MRIMIKRTTMTCSRLATWMNFDMPLTLYSRQLTSVIKVYVCVFVVLSIKAVHLEAVTSLTSDFFLDASQQDTVESVTKFCSDVGI